MYRFTAITAAKFSNSTKKPRSWGIFKLGGYADTCDRSNRAAIKQGKLAVMSDEDWGEMLEQQMLDEQQKKKQQEQQLSNKVN